MDMKQHGGKLLTKNYSHYYRFLTITFTFVSCLILSSCGYKEKMLKVYKNDESYCKYFGTISFFEKETHDNGNFLNFSSVTKIDDNNNEVEVDIRNEFHGNNFLIHSKNSKKVWDDLNPYIGQEISFVSCPVIFHHGYFPPIVQITFNEVEVLAFSDGKEALLESVNKM